LVGQEPHVPYDRPPLSKDFLRGEKTRGDLFFDPPSYLQNQRITLKLGVTVLGLDLSAKTASLSDGETIAFEKALLATGGRPLRLSLPGSDLEGIHYLRTLDDAAAIATASRQGTRVVIIGAGFIGLEVAASLTQRGAKVTVLEAHARIWPRFADPTLAAMVQGYCTEKGVTFLTNETVAAFGGTGRVSSVLTKAGKRLPCDLVCVGIGIVPNVESAQQAGLVVENGIVVNDRLQTSHPDIYAAGDVANYPDPYFGRRRRVEHWGHAEYCGQVAGHNMAGAARSYDLLTYVWSDIFDLHLEFAGDESEQDETLVRGRVEENVFTLLYLKEKILRAYFAVNTGAKDFPALQKLIKQKKDLSGKEAQIRDHSVPVKNLV